MKKWQLLCPVNLRLFDGDGAGAAGGTGAGTGGMDGSSDAGKEMQADFRGANADTRGAQGRLQKGEDAPAGRSKGLDRRAEFERMVQGEYKDLFSERMQAVIDKRFRETKTLQEQSQQMRPMLEALAVKYGVTAGDTAALQRAVENEAAQFGEKAARLGMTPEQLRYMERMAETGRGMRQNQDRQRRQEQADRMYRQWAQEGEALRQIYPSFDFRRELQNPRFANLIRNSVDVRTAYEVVHKDEILGGAMQYTAQEVSKKIVDGIRAKAARPAENGIRYQSTAVIKPDVNRMKREDRDSIERRVLKGERISF